MPPSKRSVSYTELAAQRFLDGLPYGSPVAAIEAGVRTVQDWCDLLNEVRRAHTGHFGVPSDALPVAGSGDRT